MRKSNRTLLAIAAALLASTGLAGAQGQGGMSKGDGASSAPAAEQQAPAGKAAPHNGAAQHERSGATERRSQSTEPSGRSETTGQAPRQGETPRASPDKSGSDAGSRTEPTPKASGGTRSGTETKSGTGAATQEKNGGTVRPGERTQSQSPSTTTGQGAAGTRSAVSLSTEQRTKIRTVIKEKVHAQPLTKVNFNISVGTKVPRTVHFYPLPAEVVEIHPAWRGYDFVLVEEQIVVIDPRTFEIVAIIEA
jgi:hypothetical protein